MRATIADVAEKANVSKTTVSRILAGTEGFKYSEETVAKVVSAADELNYIPSSAAQLMRLKDIKMVGICTQPVNSMFSHSQLEKLSAKIKEFGYYPILIDLNESFELFGSSHLHRLDYLRGVVCLYSSQVSAVKKLCAKHNKGIPIISLGSDTEAVDNVKVVATDHDCGRELAMQHLQGLGHKTIADVSFDSNNQLKIRTVSESDECEEILKVAGESVNIYSYGNVIVEFLLSNRGATEGGRRITAVSCPNDEVAMAVISGLYKSNVRVPEEISVVGYDNLPFAAYTTPGLTTISQNTDEQILAATKVLISSIEGNSIVNDFIPGYTKIVPELVVRESTSALENGGSE